MTTNSSDFIAPEPLLDAEFETAFSDETTQTPSPNATPAQRASLVAIAAAAASALAACGGGGGSDSAAPPAPGGGSGAGSGRPLPGTPPGGPNPPDLGTPAPPTAPPEPPPTTPNPPNPPEPPPTQPDPVKPPPAVPVTAAEAAQFLSQATLGAGRTQIEALTRMSLDDWLDDQFSQPVVSHVAWLKSKGYADPDKIFSSNGMDNTVWRALIGGSDPLRQRVVLALSEICVVSILGVNSSWRPFAMGYYLDILQKNAFGNYRTLLEELSLCPAMASFLTYRNNAKANPKTGSQPDENYAREIMQLFTIGLVQLRDDGSVVTNGGKEVESYSTADVSGLARVFTGWTDNESGLTRPYPPDIVIRPLVQNASRYETGAKQFLGTTIADGTDARTALGMALDTLFNHANLPPFVSRQLIQRLVTSNPSPAYIGRVVAVFKNNGAGVRGDMRAVVRAVLMDPDARNPARLQDPNWGKLREPVQRFVHWARAFGGRSPSGDWDVGNLSDPASRLGQSPLRSPSVFNFFRPGYVPPNTALASKNLVGPEFQITNESTVAGYVNFMQSAVTGRSVGDLQCDYSALLALAGNAEALIAELKLVLTCEQLGEPTRLLIISVINSMPAKTQKDLENRVHAALTLVLASPDYIVQN